MVFAHSFVGAPITYLLTKNLNISEKFKNLLYFVGITGAVLPDFDLILGFFIEDINHRKLVSHSVIPYLVFFILVYVLAGLFKTYTDKLRLINLVLFVSILSHLIIDLLVGGVVFFAPFDLRTYGYEIPFSNTENFFLKYFTSPYAIYELVLISSFYIFQRYSDYRKIFLLSYLYFVLAFLMVIRYSYI